MSRAPLVAFVALLGFVALVALGVGWTPLAHRTVSSNTQGDGEHPRVGAEAEAPQAAPDTGFSPLATSPTPPDTPSTAPTVPRERSDSLRPSTAGGARGSV